MRREQATDRGNLGQSTTHIGLTAEDFEAQANDGSGEAQERVRADRNRQAVQGRNPDDHLVAKEKAYLVETEDGIFRITVPADWLITFGPMYVSNKTKPGSPGSIPTALRFYEGKHQRACMLNVTNFYDMDMQIEEPVGGMPPIHDKNKKQIEPREIVWRKSIVHVTGEE